MKNREPSGVLANPPWVDALFGSARWAWVWLMARLWLGLSWLDAGSHKMTQDAWVGGGMAVKGFWERAVTIPEQGRPPIAYDWYRGFIEFLLRNELHAEFGVLLAWGQVLVGLALIVGAFTGIAAFFGAVMNLNFMLAGAGGTNLLLGLAAISLIAAWKVAGWWGADRVLLPALGAPWERGALFGGGAVSVEGGAAAGAGVGWHVEQWVRMLAAAAIAVYALEGLDGVPQLVVFALAALLAGTTGRGVWFFSKR